MTIHTAKIKTICHLMRRTTITGEQKNKHIDTFSSGISQSFKNKKNIITGFKNNIKYNKIKKMHCGRRYKHCVNISRIKNHNVNKSFLNKLANKYILKFSSFYF